MANAQKIVTNGGSAIGEAIGHNMELILHEYIDKFLEDYHCHFIKETGYNPQTGKTSKKLLLYDNYGNDYNIDGVITDESMRPLVLLESKYIRYKKHNRDKGSWICNAHSAIRKRYASIRASIAVLAGSWSKTSLAMIKSYDVNVFLVPFEFISSLLREVKIDFEWEENDKDKAMLAWNKYQALPDAKKRCIAIKMVNLIKTSLLKFLAEILDDTKTREIKKVIVEIITNIGETRRYIFESREEAVEFLNRFSLDDEFDGASLLSIYDLPIVED